METFIQQLINGITLASVHSLVALCCTMSTALAPSERMQRRPQ